MNEITTLSNKCYNLLRGQTINKQELYIIVSIGRNKLRDETEVTGRDN